MSTLSRTPLVVVGAGGHAKVVISTLQAMGLPILAAFDDNQERWGTRILGVRVDGPIDQVLGLPNAVGVIAVGDNAVRRRVAERLAHVQWANAVHPRAYVHPSVRIGPGTVVFAGAVVQPDVIIGNHAVVNTGATVDHDCTLGDFVHVAPGAHLAGGVQVEDGVLLGVGTSVIPGRRIGEWTRVGAGSVVVHDVPRDLTVVGIPARPIMHTVEVRK